MDDPEARKLRSEYLSFLDTIARLEARGVPILPSLMRAAAWLVRRIAPWAAEPPRRTI